MRNSIKILIWIVVVVVLIFGGIKAVKHVRAKDAMYPIAKIYPIVVKSFSPKISHVRLTLPVITLVQNDKNVQLAARVSARILYIKLSGQRVKKGEIVVRLDTTALKSNLLTLLHKIKATKIALKNLQATHKRTAELLKVKGVSIEEFTKEATSLASIKASIISLKQQEVNINHDLSYAVIKSPVNGIISKVFINKGSISLPGHPLVAISADNGFYLLLRVPADVPVKGLIFKGKMYSAIALYRTYNGLLEYKIYVEVKNLITGDRLEANVVVFNSKGTFLPFNTILNRNNGKNYVLVINHHRATLQEIHIIEDGQQGIVASNLSKNEQIVVGHQDVLLKLVGGSTLNVAN